MTGPRVIPKGLAAQLGKKSAGHTSFEDAAQVPIGESGGAAVVEPSVTPPAPDAPIRDISTAPSAQTPPGVSTRTRPPKKADKRGDEPLTQVSAYIRKGLHREVKAQIARMDNVNMSSLVDELLERWLKAQRV